MSFGRGWLLVLLLAPTTACGIDDRALVATRNDGDGGTAGDEPPASGAPSAGSGSESSASGGSPDAPETCGNGALDADEECDPGAAPQDGCRDCQLTPGYECTGAPSSCRRCTGPAGERRCFVVEGSFERGDEDASAPASVGAFWLDEQEITVARFREFVTAYEGAPASGAGAHPSIAGSGWQSAWSSALPADSAALAQSLHCNHDWQTWSDEPESREDFPIACVSYYVAFAFCVASGGRLPTEAEWEYAAAGGDEQRPYPWGSAMPSAELALFGSFGPAPSTHFPGRGRFGQVDLAGSVYEWTLDVFAPYPESCDDCAALDSGTERVLRGGSFSQGASALLSSARYRFEPTQALADVGLRCAYDL
jgi:formylglycine-generating enzyme